MGKEKVKTKGRGRREDVGDIRKGRREGKVETVRGMRWKKIVKEGISETTEQGPKGE